MNTGQEKSDLNMLKPFHKKIQLFRGLLSKEAKTGPFFVTFDIIGRCNLKCIGCPFHTPLKSHDPPSQDFPLGLFQRLCDELADLNTCSVVLQGTGEPLLHPDLFQMIEAANSKNFEIIILTNGTLLSRKMCQRVLDSGMDVLKVSLWATTPAEFEKNYGGTSAGVFDKIVQGVQCLSKLKKKQGSKKPKIIFRYVINKNNYHSIDNVVTLARQAEVDGIDFTVMNNSSGAVDSIMLEEDEVANVCRDLKHVKKRLTRLGLTHNINDIRFRYRTGAYVLEKVPCTIPWVHVRVCLDGHVCPCSRCLPNVDFGDTNTQSFQEIWNGPAIKDFRRLVMKRGAGSKIMENCDCRYCCFVCDNKKVDRVFHWFRPLVQKFN